MIHTYQYELRFQGQFTNSGLFLDTGLRHDLRDLLYFLCLVFVPTLTIGSFALNTMLRECGVSKVLVAMMMFDL
jgi:hypothetical protein